MAITFSCDVSRTSGVAPLAVFVDCTGTTATGVTYPFHELFYEHSFGDSGAGFWQYGAQAGTASKNYATGACAAHVFETPGTYTITSRCWDGSAYSYEQNTITVTDPVDIFPSTNTICVGATGVPSSGECPAGATRIQQSNFATIISTYAKTGKRVLLKRGDTFTISSGTYISETGSMIIGAFGSGAKPQINATSDMYMCRWGNGDHNSTFSDITIMDLSCDGGNYEGSSCFGLQNTTVGLDSALLFRNDMTNFNNPISLAPEQVNLANNNNGWSLKHDKIFIVENTYLGGTNSGYCIYGSGIRVACMGNQFDNGGYNVNPPNTHLTRWLYLNRAVFCHNNLFRPGETRHMLYIIGPPWASGAPVIADNQYSAAFCGDGISKLIVVSDNYFMNSNTETTGWQIDITAISGREMHIIDVIVERNLHKFGLSTQAALTVRADYITCRNNILIGSINTGDTYFVWVAFPESNDLDGGEQNPSNHDIWVYNNTLYRSTSGGGQVRFIYLPDTGTTGVIVRNNIIAAPAASSSVLCFPPGSTYTQSNNTPEGTGSGQMNNSTVPFVDSTPTNLVDFRPTSASGGTSQFPAINRDMFNGMDKTGATRMGALVPKANARCSGAK